MKFVPTTVISVALLICVVVVCLAPVTSLEPTALRAAQMALALMLGLGTINVALIIRISFSNEPVPCHSEPQTSDESLIDLVCSRLC